MADLQTALDAIKAKLPDCQRYTNYYNGKHELSFASDKFRTAFGETLRSMRDNLCPIIVDAPADRMEIVNFSGDKPDAQSAVADAAWKLWQRENLELVSNDVHKEALKCGIGYVIVWSDAEGKLAQFYAQDSRQCVVIENANTNKPLYGAKQWLTDAKYIRVTLYYPDRIEKYISRKSYDGSAHDNLKESSFTFVAPDSGEEAIIPNPYGVIPMFRFKTNPVLNDAIPIQDALNKTICDKLVAMEFSAFRQRWATGLTPPMNEITGNPELPFKAGADRLWFTTEEGVKFGEFGTTDLQQFLNVADSYRLEMARVSGTPLYFFAIDTSDSMSGEALKTLESRFVKRVKRLSINFGSVWSDAMEFALAIEGSGGADNITAQWENPEQRSEKETCETLLLKQKLGIPDNVLQEELGYTAEDIAKFEKEKERKAQLALERMQEAGTNPAQAATNGDGSPPRSPVFGRTE